MICLESYYIKWVSDANDKDWIDFLTRMSSHLSSAKRSHTSDSKASKCWPRPCRMIKGASLFRNATGWSTWVARIFRLPVWHAQRTEQSLAKSHDGEQSILFGGIKSK